MTMQTDVPALDSWMRVVRSRPDGRPVVLLHGNPTSSHLWRHVLSAAEQASDARSWTAVDLIGMGGSGKPACKYTFADHSRFLDASLDALQVDEVSLVGHDWGAALAVDWARRHPGRVHSIAVMETHLRPLARWTDLDEGGRALFQQLRESPSGERMVLQDNFFLDTLLPAALPQLDQVDLSAYREPYPDQASRIPLLQWARQIPVAGEPADIAATVQANIDFLSTTALPVALVHADPGVLVTPDTVRWFRRSAPHARTVDVGGPAGHFLPEDRPEHLAAALLEWV